MLLFIQARKVFPSSSCIKESRIISFPQNYFQVRWLKGYKRSSSLFSMEKRIFLFLGLD